MRPAITGLIALTLGCPIAETAGGANSLTPDWVRPGLRLTYDLITGGVNRTADQLAWDAEKHEWVQSNINRGYDTNGNYNGEHSSRGLIQATVAGMDGQVVALSQSFYLLSPGQRTPMLMPGGSSDMVVTADTGGDFWMHPARQAQLLRQPPAGVMVQSTTWRGGNQAWKATTLVSQSASGKTFYAYDQATGKLLYLSRITRDAPGEGRIRDPKTFTQGNPVSYATILKYVDSRQMNIPWMNDPLPEAAQQLHTLSYQGRQSVQFPGAAPSGGQAVQQIWQVQRRGANWILLQGNVLAQWQISSGPGPKIVSGSGMPTPLIVPPSGMAKLRPGQIIDQDALTGFTVRVAGADGRTLALEADGPDRSTVSYYGSADGVMMRTMTRERQSAGQNMFTVREMQLAGKQ